MTFRELYQKDFPKNADVDPADRLCPSSCDYEEDWDCESTEIGCDECWDREVPEAKIYFLCDGEVEKCKESPRCYKNHRLKDTKEACRYTTDISHAENFRGVKSGNRKSYTEKENLAYTGSAYPTSPLFLGK